jgi:6-phosphogluconolactonase (cycloisomerase 2 family)
VGCPVANAAVLYLEEPGQIQAFQINHSTGTLGTPATVATTGTGGMIATPDTKFMYVTDPQNDQVDAFAIDPTTGALTPLPGSPFPLNSSTQSASGIGIDPTGKFLYVSDLFGSDILGFSINQSTGTLTGIAGSPFSSGFFPARILVSPANFAEVVDIGTGVGGISSFTVNPANGALSPGVSGPLTYLDPEGAEDMVMHASGRYLYISQGMTSATSSVAGFTLDQTTGFPTPFSSVAFPTGLSPRNMAADPNTKFLYTANTGAGTISGFAIDAATGNLAPVPGTPFSATISPPTGGLISFQLVIDPAGQFLYATNPQQENISIFALVRRVPLLKWGVLL